jgi:RimJ/RimL family protein N-acetyltransferase
MRYRSVEEFGKVVEPLMASEAENNLALGILETIRNNPAAYSAAEPYLGYFDNLVVLRTPPYLVLLAPLGEVTPDTIVEVVSDILDFFEEDLPGVLGPPELADTFTQEVVDRTGLSSKVAMAHRAFLIEELEEGSGSTSVPGSSRLATPDDRPLLSDWYLRFHEEALGEPSVEKVEKALDRIMADDPARVGLWVWTVKENDEERVVSMAGYSGPTPNGIFEAPPQRVGGGEGGHSRISKKSGGVRIIAVYTPPDLRGHGYATALVRELTGFLLERRRFVFLNTDLANPTSNSIYTKMGYRPIGNSTMIDFVRL